MTPSPPTEYEIRKIARRTVNIIDNLSGAKNVCLLGSAASALWADIKRVPNDIDILVTHEGSEKLDPEEIKRGIVEADSRYYLRPSRKPGANYEVLFCRLPGFRTERRRVKVDILIPLTPRLWLPKVLSEDTWLIRNIPVMPLFDLLVMKIQGWRDHRASRREDFLAKVETDVTDVRALLVQARLRRISYRKEYRLHTRGFMNRAQRLALGFVEVCGGQTKFQALDFPM